jgi:hypothetical protein
MEEKERSREEFIEEGLEEKELEKEVEKEVKKEEVVVKVRKDVKRGEGVKKGGGFSFRSLVINVLVSLLVSFSVIYVYDRYYAQKIVTFDLKGYIVGLRGMYMAGRINDEGLRQAIDAAYMVIKSQKKNKVVLMGDVVLTPVERIDYPIKIEANPSIPHYNMNGTQGGVDGGVK